MANEGMHEWAGEQDLINYLQDTYINDDGEELDNEEVLEAVRTEFAEGVIETGKTMGSYVYFIGDQIARAEGWASTEDQDPDEEDEEDDEDYNEPVEDDDNEDDEDGEQDHAEGLD